STSAPSLSASSRPHPRSLRTAHPLAARLTIRRHFALIFPSNKNKGAGSARLEPGKKKKTGEHMDRMERLYALHKLLRGRRTPISAEALAERLGCSKQTVYRAINELRNYLNAPIPEERGKGFYYDRSEEHTSELQSRENLVC